MIPYRPNLFCFILGVFIPVRFIEDGIYEVIAEDETAREGDNVLVPSPAYGWPGDLYPCTIVHTSSEYQL